jgi:hypothetical protein
MDGNTLPSAGHEKKRPRVSGHGYTKYTQVFENSLKVSIIVGGYLETYIAADKLGKLTGSVGREIGRLPEGEDIPLFHDTFLSGGAAHVVCIDK